MAALSAPPAGLVRHAAPALLLVVAAFAATSAAAQRAPLSSAPPARVIVTGEGSVRVPPDYAKISSGVTTRGKTAKEASDANAKLMNAVYTALHAAGIAQSDIQTVRFSVQPIYTAHQPNAEPRLTGFAVSNEVRVRVAEIAAVGGILDALIAAGATDIGNVQFLHADTVKALDQARQDAIADARHKAEIYARASGLSLGSVAWVTEDGGLVPTPPLAARAFSAAQTSISPGEDTLRVAVTVGFEVAP